MDVMKSAGPLWSHHSCTYSCRNWLVAVRKGVKVLLDFHLFIQRRSDPRTRMRFSLCFVYLRENRSRHRNHWRAIMKVDMGFTKTPKLVPYILDSFPDWQGKTWTNSETLDSPLSTDEILQRILSMNKFQRQCWSYLNLEKNCETHFWNRRTFKHLMGSHSYLPSSACYTWKLCNSDQEDENPLNTVCASNLH